MISIDDLVDKSQQEEQLRDFKASLLSVLTSLEAADDQDYAVITHMTNPVISTMFVVDDQLLVDISCEEAANVLLTFDVQEVVEFTEDNDTGFGPLEAADWPEEDADAAVENNEVGTA